MAIEVGTIVCLKSNKAVTAVIVGDAHGEECPASEDCDLTPFEVRWLTISPMQVRFGVCVGDTDPVCLHDIMEVS